MVTFQLHTAGLLQAMRSTGHVWSYKAWCSAVISCFSTALIGAFRSLLFHSVISSLGGPLSHSSPVVVSKLLEFLFHCPCWLTQFFWLPSDNTELSLENVLDVWSELSKQLNWFMLAQQVLHVSKQHALLSRARGMLWK